MSRRAMFVGAVAIAIAAAISVANAQGRGGFGGGMGVGRGGGFGQGLGGGRPGGPRGGGPMDPMAEFAKVNLSGDQQKQIRDILDGDREANRDNMAAMADAQRALHDAIFAAAPDAGAVSNAQSRVAEAQTAELAARVKTQSAIAAILTPEQRAKLTNK